AVKVSSLKVRGSALPAVGDGIFIPAKSFGPTNNAACLVSMFRPNRRSSCSSIGFIRRIEDVSDRHLIKQAAPEANMKFSTVLFCRMASSAISRVLAGRLKRKQRDWRIHRNHSRRYRKQAGRKRLTSFRTSRTRTGGGFGSEPRRSHDRPAARRIHSRNA